jgi:hypothetical protein
LKTIVTEDAKTMKKEQVTSFRATEIMVKNMCTLEAKSIKRVGLKDFKAARHPEVVGYQNLSSVCS